MDYWQKAPWERDQLVLFAPTLEERIPEDHPVRLIDEVLDAYDWSEWEAKYHGRRGQPPIHPRVLAAVLLYGLIRGVTRLHWGRDPYCGVCGNPIRFAPKI
jgi:transposase